jgi:hypothetical protein
MNIPKRWVTLVWPLSQALIAVELGMALERWGDGRASSLTVITILMCVGALACLIIVQTVLAAQKDHIGGRP